MTKKTEGDSIVPMYTKTLKKKYVQSLLCQYQYNVNINKCINVNLTSNYFHNLRH